MMTSTLKGLIVGTLAVAGAGLMTVEAEAMPVQPLTQTVAAGGQIEPVYYYRYGYRRPFVRRFGFRRPFYVYPRLRPYGFARPFYGYRRPYYGYGYRRW